MAPVGKDTVSVLATLTKVLKCMASATTGNVWPPESCAVLWTAVWLMGCPPIAYCTLTVLPSTIFKVLQLCKKGKDTRKYSW
jgi:hypothetical protein